ncbi:MAG: xylose isomerase, partial [Lentisphaerae bacterium]|nr:xylose isomerase [Lentisphaerota bacterium]
LDKHNYGSNGEWVGLDVKAMRTQKAGVATKHLSNSREIFLRLLEISRSLDDRKVAALIKERNYEELEMLIVKSLIR